MDSSSTDCFCTCIHNSRLVVWSLCLRQKGPGNEASSYEFCYLDLSAVKNEEQAAGEPEKPAEPEEQEPTSAEPEQAAAKPDKPVEPEPSATEPEQGAAEPEKQPELATAGGGYYLQCTCGFTISHLENFVTLARFSLYSDLKWQHVLWGYMCVTLTTQCCVNPPLH